MNANQQKNIAKLVAHAEAAGREDYESRANDVAMGEDPTWAWPHAGADEAYINAVTSEAICRAAGVPEGAWEYGREAWLDAFGRGYVAAHPFAEE